MSEFGVTVKIAINGASCSPECPFLSYDECTPYCGFAGESQLRESEAFRPERNKMCIAAEKQSQMQSAK